MESSFNRIELAGVVGRASLTAVGDTRVARFSLATNTFYKGKDGRAVVDTTWFSATAWEGPAMPDLTRIQRGSRIHLQGRVRIQSYVDANGSDRQNWEIECSSLEIMED